MHVRRIIATVAASALVALPALAAATPVSAASRACVDETYQWAGPATLAPGATLATGVAVPAQPGTDIVVTGTSSDALDSGGFATPLGVSIGGATATVGATVPGGEIVLQHISGDAELTVHGATVTVSRCTTVAQEGPIRPASTGGGGARSGGELPSTGASPAVLTIAAAALVAAGGAALASARRREIAAQS